MSSQTREECFWIVYYSSLLTLCSLRKLALEIRAAADLRISRVLCCRACALAIRCRREEHRQNIDRHRLSRSRRGERWCFLESRTTSRSGNVQGSITWNLASHVTQERCIHPGRNVRSAVVLCSEYLDQRKSGIWRPVNGKRSMPKIYHLR